MSLQESTTAETLFTMIDREPERFALFLDIDGTLIDLAPTPDQVSVPPELPPALTRLSERLGGALALVTGRSLQNADALFAPLQFPAAGLHGAEIRVDDRLLLVEPSPDFIALKRELIAETERFPGVLIEDKGAAVAAHFRLAPQFEEEMLALMRAYAGRAGAAWALQFGKMVIELRPAGSTKGNALERFLKSERFRNRLPVAIGDDLTDEAMFAIANARGGTSIRVGAEAHQSCATGHIASASQVRETLLRLAGTGA